VNEEVKDLLLDNNDLERERGITILAKNVSVRYKDTKINIIDTPGHSDFGGEVERVLNMADGVILLVDAFEGPMPQTRFVLGKAIELGLKPVVVINKVDKPNCTPEEVHEAVFDLMFALDATEDQLDFPVVYGSSKNGWMGPDWKTPTEDVSYLLDVILEHIPAPKQVEGTLQMRITSLDYSSFQGSYRRGTRFARIDQAGQFITLVKNMDGTVRKGQVKELMVFEGLGKVKVKDRKMGAARSSRHGLGELRHRRYRCRCREPGGPVEVQGGRAHHEHALHHQHLALLRQGGRVRHQPPLARPLFKEIEKNLAMRVTGDRQPGPSAGLRPWHPAPEHPGGDHAPRRLRVPAGPAPSAVQGSGRIERCEPIELLTVQVPEQFSSRVIDHVTRRKGEIMNIEQKAIVRNSSSASLLVASSVCAIRCSPPRKVRRSSLTASRAMSLFKGEIAAPVLVAS
jgi:GTP-binding protein